MKTPHPISSFKCFSLLVGLLTAASWASAGTLVLEDNFNGASLNSSLWTIGAAMGNSSVVQAGGLLTSNNAGYLISSGSYTGSLELETAITLSGTNTSGALAWKTDGTFPLGISSHNTSGIAVVLFNESQTAAIFVKDKITGENSTYTSVPYFLPLGTSIPLRILDSGSSVSVFLNGSSTPTVSLSYNPDVVGPNGKLEFFSRDSVYTPGAVGASMDFINVYSTPDLPNTLVLFSISVIGVIGFGLRRRI